MKKFSFWILLIVVSYSIIELVSYCGLLFLKVYRDTSYEPVDVISARHSMILNKFIEKKAKYTSFSPDLGWTIKKNGKLTQYQSNSLGIRSNREYRFIPPNGVRRVTTFGDSYTHCDNVENDETWQAIMERNEPNLEVLNFGVPGYGLDQAYLRYLIEGYKYKSQIVLIGFMSENIYRVVNNYRPFYNKSTGIPLMKPRFIIHDGKLSLISNPAKTLNDYMHILHSRNALSEIGINDYYYKRRYKSNLFDFLPSVRIIKILVNEYYKKPTNEDIIVHGKYNVNSEAFKITKMIFDEFYNQCIKNESTPVILIFPNKSDIKRNNRNLEVRYTPLLSYFDSKGYKYIDLMHAFKNNNLDDLFGHHHYSPLADKIVGIYILNYLNNMNINNK